MMSGEDCRSFTWKPFIPPSPSSNADRFCNRLPVHPLLGFPFRLRWGPTQTTHDPDAYRDWSVCTGLVWFRDIQEVQYGNVIAERENS